jgi:hypothetical protein
MPNIKLEREPIALCAGSLDGGPQPSQGFDSPEPEIRESEQSTDGTRPTSLSSPEYITGRMNYGADAICPNPDSLTPYPLQKEEVFTEFRSTQATDEDLSVMATSQGS